MKKLCSTKDMPREEWLSWRRGGIGGSDAAVIVGLNPYRSRLELYADKLGLMPEREDSEAMRIGRDLEAYVADRWAEATGKKYRRTNFMYCHDRYDFIRANVDREVIGEKAGLECKTTSVYNKSDFENGEIPLAYYCQCQHYMAVMGYERMYLAVLALGKAFYHFVIDRSEEEINTLLENEVDFWRQHVENGIPPEPDGSESAAAAIRAMQGESSRPEGFKLMMQYENDLAHLNALNGQIKALQQETEAIRQALMLALGEAESGESEQYVLNYRPQNRVNVDLAALREKYPQAYKECSKNIQYRALKIKEKRK